MMKTKVKFNGASKEQIAWGGNNNPNEVLVVGQIYDVTDIEVHSWHTKIQLQGIEGKFNSASFDWLDEASFEEAKRKWRNERNTNR